MNTHIWRYEENQRNYPGYNLSADADGCAALLAGLRSLRKTAKFQLDPVTQQVLKVPNNRGGSASYLDFKSFKLEVRPDASSDHLHFSEELGSLSLECSPQQVELMIKGVEDIRRGEGDYCIQGSDRQALWFWWYPKGQSKAPR